MQANAVMLPDVLPFYLAIESSPTDARIAFAVVRPVADDADLEVSVFLEDRNACIEVFRFSRLAFVHIAWSACGDLLAFAQNSTLMTRNADGALRLFALQGEVQLVGFDRDRRLWCLAGGRLEARFDGRVVAAINSVKSAAVCTTVVYCRRETVGVCLYLRDGDYEQRLACISENYELVKLTLRGTYLAAVLTSTSVRDQVSARILQFDLASSRMDTILDCQLPIGFNAGPGLAAVVTNAGDVYAAYEDGPCTRVWNLAPGRRAQPVSPDGFEVFDFVVHPDGNQLALIASDTRASLGTFDRQLLVGQRAGSSWRFLPPVAGVHDMPRWRADGLLEVLRGDTGRWIKSTHSPGQAKAVPRAQIYVTALASGAVELDLLRLPGPDHRRSGIILLPRLHQQFAAGAQSLFFHHLLFSIARSLASDGYTVVTLSGPGAIGRGRRRRELAGSYLAHLRTALGEVVRTLRATGCQSVGILAGSLAAVPALRLLGQGSEFSACALVAPLFEASIPVTAPVRHHLLDDPHVQTLDAAAANLETPLFVVHGARDEVAPLSQVVRLCSRVPKASLIETCIFEDEGHIFKKLHSWQRAQSKIRAFFSSRMVV